MNKLIYINFDCVEGNVFSSGQSSYVLVIFHH